MASDSNKIKGPSSQGRTAKSYGEVKMDLFVPPGGKTRNWYARIYIPKDLLCHYGDSLVFKKSMRTPDKLLAQARAAEFLKEKSLEFLEKRAQQSTLTNSRVPKPIVIDKYLIERYAALRLQDLVGYDDEVREGVHDWDDHEGHVAERHAFLKSLLSRRRQAPGWDDFTEYCLDFAEIRGDILARTDPQFDDFILAMLRVENRAYAIMTARNDGEDAGVAVHEGGVMLSEVLNDWRTESNLLTDEKTRQTYLSRIEHFIEFVRDKPLVRVERSDVYAWYKQLLFEDQLHANTVRDGYRPALNSLLNFAVNAGAYGIQQNPAQGVALPKLTRQQSKERSRPQRPLSATYLNLLFASGWYAGKSQRERKYSKLFLTGGARYWVPLIAMAQGLRPEEILQLTLLDVGVQGGVWAIHVTDEEKSAAQNETGEGKTVKNEPSIRWVPVHRVLLELGFSDYVAEQRCRQGVPAPEDAFRERLPGETVVLPDHAGRLFPEADTEFERSANAFGKLFNDYIRSKLKFEKTYVLYSFRHSWEDRLRIAKARTGPWPEGVSFALSGRAKMQNDKGKLISREDEEGSAIFYGDGFPPRVLKRYLDEVDFSDVVLPKPWAEFMRR